jgi:uncharacterized membrane protein YkoI
MRIRPTLSLAAALALPSVVFAQPADRPAAFTQAVGVAMARVPSFIFHEAELENDHGQWLIKVELVAPSAAQQAELEISTTTFGVLKSETEGVFPAQQAVLQALLAQVGTASLSPAQAIAAAAPRTPSGQQLRKMELQLEHGALAYKFEFSGGGRVFINAATGAASGSGSTNTGTSGSGGSGGGGGGSDDLPSGPLPTAVQTALAAYPGARVLEVEFEPGDDRWEVKIVTAQGEVRKLRVSTAGAVLGDDAARQSREDRARDRLRTLKAQGAQITLEQATQAALAANPGTTAVKAEWEFEHGVLVAKVIVQDAVGQRTVLIGASSGAVVTPVPAPAPAPAPVPVLTPAAAAQAALAVNPGATAIEVEAEAEGGRVFYKVRTLTTAQPLRLRETVVDGKTGQVWSTTLMPMAADYLARARRVNALLPTRARTLAQAQSLALATLGDGTVESIELEPEDAGLAYRVDVRVGETVFPLRVDAATGEVRPR